MSNNRLLARRFSIALILSIVYLAAPVWADFKAGEKAYQSGDYATALHEWQSLAEQGQAGAQYQLGLLYANGKVSQRTMPKHGSGTKKLRSKGIRKPKSIWEYC